MKTKELSVPARPTPFLSGLSIRLWEIKIESKTGVKVAKRLGMLQLGQEGEVAEGKIYLVSVKSGDRILLNQ